MGAQAAAPKKKSKRTRLSEWGYDGSSSQMETADTAVSEGTNSHMDTSEAASGSTAAGKTVENAVAKEGESAAAKTPASESADPAGNEPSKVATDAANEKLKRKKIEMLTDLCDNLLGHGVLVYQSTRELLAIEVMDAKAKKEKEAKDDEEVGDIFAKLLHRQQPRIRKKLMETLFESLASRPNLQRKRQRKKRSLLRARLAIATRPPLSLPLQMRVPPAKKALRRTAMVFRQQSPNPRRPNPRRS